MPPAVRKVATGVVALAGLCTVLLFGDRPLVVAVSAVAVIFATNRSRLLWLLALPEPGIVRRAARVAVYFPPMIVLGPPKLTADQWTVVAAVVIAIPPLLAEWRSIRFSFRAEYLAAWPITGPERAKELITFALSGAAQEYAYRWVLLVPLLAWNPVAAIGISTAVFVAEHYFHRGGFQTWDLQDAAVQAYLGIVLGVSVWLTGSLAVALIAHTLYNLPNVLQALLRRKSRTGGVLNG